MSSITEAFSMMLARPVRSVLSLVGIVIGLLTLLAVLSIWSAARKQVETMTRLRHSQVFFVTPAFNAATGRAGLLGSDQIHELNQVSEVESVMARLVLNRKARSGAVNSLSVNLVGIDAWFAPIYGIVADEGRLLLPFEASRRSSVCLLSPRGRKKLFPLGSAIGQSISLEGDSYTVIGVVGWDSASTQRAFLAEEPDLLVPISNLEADRKDGLFSMIEVRTALRQDPESLQRIIIEKLAHGDAKRESLYAVQSQQDYARSRQMVLNHTLGSLLAICMISLLVGGIGIANVMLISVTERISEIGLRMALGASRQDILNQFLVEGSVLTLSGAFIAIFIAVIVQASFQLMQKNSPYGELSWSAVAGCALISCLIGLLASVYPASHAGALSPAEALTHV